jgi:outer membrane protein TolC
MSRGAVAVLSAILIAASLLAAGERPTDLDDPMTQIQAVVAAALRSPELEGIRADLDAQAAASRVRVHVGVPFAELEREGLDLDLDPQPNAIWFLRFGLPFNWLGQGSSVSRFIEATDRHVEAESRLADLEIAGQAVAAWLALAATGERILVREDQLDRLASALELQRKRLELGEISGHEVMQLELERVRVGTELAALRSTRASDVAALDRIAGVAAPRPRGNVLARLLDGLRPFEWRDETEQDLIEGSPWLEASAAEVERNRTDRKQAGRTAFGRPEFEVNWARVPDIGQVPGFDALGLRLTVPLPLGEAGKRRRAVADAGVRLAGARAEQTHREVEARLQAAVARASEAAATLAMLREIESEIPRIEHSLVQQYRLGATSYLVYLDGLARLDDVRLQSIDARQGELLARLELAVVTGDATLFPLPAFDEESSP